MLQRTASACRLETPMGKLFWDKSDDLRTDGTESEKVHLRPSSNNTEVEQEFLLQYLHEWSRRWLKDRN